MTRPTVDAWALGIAAAVASRGECTRRRVGAVILDEHGRVVSTGYNGAPPGEPSCLNGACPRACLDTATAPPGIGYAATGCTAIHAEDNAITEAGRARTRGCTIYITCEPCVLCAPKIRGAGVVRAVWPGGEWVAEAKESRP